MELIDQVFDGNRRIFIKGIGLVSAAFVASSLLGGCEKIVEAIKNRPIRRRVRTGSPDVDNDIAILKDAVSKMKALPASDPRSWLFQANLHGTPSGFRFCQHNTNHFFSWHRAYLFYFEKICQELTGQKKFGLPYWNWNQNPDVPTAFTTGSLNHTRAHSSLAGLSAFSNSTLNTILSDANFFTFSSQLEGTPHNSAHINIGGDLGTFISAQDPLFWAHHCMVDYCWSKWNIELDNNNTSDSAWMNTSWNHFVDGTGNPATMTAAATTIMPLLSYRYETSAIGGFAAKMDMLKLSEQDAKKIETRLRAGTDVRFDIKRTLNIAKGLSLPIAKPFNTRVRATTEEFASILDLKENQDRLFLSIKSADLPDSSDFYVRVFVNLPTANAQTPITDRHYAGSFSFFGTKAKDHPHKSSFLVNITETLVNLRQDKSLRANTPLEIQLVAVPAAKEFVKPDTRIELEDISLIISPLFIRAKS